MGGSPPFRGPSMQVSGFRIYFLEPGYFFSKILSEFRKKIVALQIGTNKAVNFLYVGIPGKYNIKAGDAFVLSMKEFTVTSDDGKTTTDWIMAVVTCKAVENK